MRGFLKTRIATVLLSSILIVALFVTAKLLWQKREIDKQISALSTRADKIRGENEQLSELVKYLSTPEFQEKEAREKLNLQKEGEIVVGLPQNEVEQVASASTNEQVSIPRKWYNYFFNHVN